MKVLGVAGPREAGREEFVRRCLDRLADDDTRVAVVTAGAEGGGDRDGGVGCDGGGGETARGEGGEADGTGNAADGGRPVVDRARTGGHGRAATPATTTCRVGPDGWTAAGSDPLDAVEVLDRLAPTHDWAVVAGPDVGADPRWRHPLVSLGRSPPDRFDRDGPPELLARADRAGAVDVDAVLTDAAAADEHETLESLVAELKRSDDADRAGAVATFTGRVRAKDAPEDPRTEFLEFERYDPVAEERTGTIRSDLSAREGVHDVALHHRIGRVHDGEGIVFVAVLAGHRREAFRAVEDGIDRLKEEVPLFKREVTVEGEFWAHDR